jgi:hypothetical protein
MVTSTSGRSRSGTRTIPMHRGGLAASIQAAITGSGTGHLQPWTRLALTLQPHGRSSSPRGRRPTCESGRCQRAWTACKYAMFDARLKLPAPSPDQRERYIRGAPIEIPAMTPHVYATHMSSVNSSLEVCRLFQQRHVCRGWRAKFNSRNSALALLDSTPALRMHFTSRFFTSQRILGRIAASF